MFNVEKSLSIDVDVIRRNFFAACNCILGNSKYQNEILKLCLQESYALPVLSMIVVQQLDLPSYS